MPLNDAMIFGSSIFILPLLLLLSIPGAICFVSCTTTHTCTHSTHPLLRPPKCKAVVEPASVSDIENAEVSESPQLTTDASTRTHTLILCRHGDSIWNGGHPGFSETFTGWTDVELSPRGFNEASMTAQLLAATYPFGIDACFTSILQRARLTAHEIVWAYGDMPSDVQPAKFVSDYRLNERHYGALQGFVKADVEAGLYGHDHKDVQMWRRGWYAVPPLLEDADPRRIEEIRMYGHYCGGADNVPRGESLEMVARGRIRPFLDEVLTPTLNQSVDVRVSSQTDNSSIEGGTGLVVAHANSLRALIGILCQVEADQGKLTKLEEMKIQTGVPLVLRYQQTIMSDGSTKIRACSQNLKGEELAEGLPIFPLSTIPSAIINRGP
jgi:2,3-bisphosphoglycerate-dependent phosphoglycerate mutase